MKTIPLCFRTMQAAVWAACLCLLTTLAGAQVIPTLPLNLRCPTNVTLWTCGDTAVWTSPVPVATGGCSNYNVICAPPVGAALPLGVHTVNCRVIDGCQNVDTCAFTITVRRDTEPPVIKCPSNIVEKVCPTAAGGCGGIIHYPLPTATDNSGAVSAVTCNPPSGSFFPCGVHVVTCVVFDRCQNRDICEFTITVEPGGQPPAIQCPADRTILTCSNTAVLAYPAPVVVPAGTTVVCVPPPGAILPLGSHAVTCTASNACGTASCSFKVEVRPVPRPVITCPDDITITLPCPSNCIQVAYAPPTVVNGNLAGCTPPPGACLTPGITTVTCVATNRCGDRDVCQFQVRVIQGPGQPPQIICPNDLTVTTCSNTCQVVAYPKPIVNNGVLVKCSPPSGFCFPIGTTTVICEASNACARAECSFDIVVRPVPPPSIRCPTNELAFTVPCNSNCVPVTYSLPPVLGGTMVACNPPSGACLPPGIHTITCVATNICGDRDVCQFRVRVNQGQGQPPQIICPNDITVTTCSNLCQPVTYPLPLVNNGVLVKCSPPPGFCFPIGATTVICEASNACARAECTFTVTVRRVPPPIIHCPTNVITLTVPCGSNCVPVVYPPPTVSNGTLVGCNPPLGTCLPVGLHPVICRATNNCGDRAECEFVVRVIQGQDQPPIIRCPQDITVVACSNDCAVVHYPAPVVIGGVLVKCDPPSGSCFPIGTTVVTCEARNACASSECKFTVTVLRDPGRPRLSIKRDGRFVVICWPKTCACYKLQSTRSLNPPIVWTDVLVAPEDHGDSWCVRLPIEPRHRFFRLIRCDQPTAPVFAVTGAGITRDQAGRLAEALGLPADQIHDEHGGLLFIDPVKFQAIPMKPVVDPALIAELRRGSETDGNSELTFEGIDFGALHELRAMDGEKAIDLWEHALRRAGIEPGKGEHVARHSLFEAVDPNGRPIMEETKLDTHVLFQFDLGGLPLIGPGANLRVAFSPGGEPTAMQAAFRQLRQEGETPILNLEEAARRCAERYPNLRGKIRPQLAYYAPSLLLPAVQKIVPCFVCSGEGSVDGQQVSLLQSIIPASEDPALTPAVLLEASAEGSLVKARATAAGGTPPYNYQWSSSSTDLGGIPSDASSIEYEATPRADETSETVRVTVTDANGVRVQASQTVEVTGGPSVLFAAAVGGVSDYGCSRGVSDLCAAQQSAFNARFALDGYTRRFNWAATTAWERDFKQGGTGLDHLYVDNVDMTFYMGHGSGQGFTFENNHDDTLLRYTDAVEAWGNVDLEWMALLSCSVIADSWGGQSWAQRWGPTFDGMHLLLGFSNTAYDEDGFANAFAQWMLGYRLGFITLPPMPIRSAWFLAKDSNQPSSVIACAVGVIGPSGLSGYNDYFWGKGPVGPDVRDGNIRGYWRVSHP